MKFVLVNAGHPPQSICASCCDPPARTYNAALLLRSQVLRQSPQGCRAGSPEACEGVMITTDALKYLPQMGLDPLRVVGCAAVQCQNSFALANGFAVEAIVAQKFSIAFFCSAGCYLNEIPSNCCARV